MSAPQNFQVTIYGSEAPSPAELGSALQRLGQSIATGRARIEGGAVRDGQGHLIGRYTWVHAIMPPETSP